MKKTKMRNNYLIVTSEERKARQKDYDETIKNACKVKT